MRGVLFQRDVDPNASPDTPAAATPSATSTRRAPSATTPPARRSATDSTSSRAIRPTLPMTRFFGNHELRVGADYQDISFDNLTQIGQEYRGRGYNETLPGGYATPQNKRIYTDPAAPGGVVASPGETYALFAQDRLNLGERWTLTYGVRVDDQTVENDIGEEVISYTKPAPRLSAVYDAACRRQAPGARHRRPLLPQRLARHRHPRVRPAVERLQRVRRVRLERRRRNATTASCATSSRSSTRSFRSSTRCTRTRSRPASTGSSTPTGCSTRRSIWSEMGDLFWSTDQFDAAGSDRHRHPQLGRRLPQVPRPHPRAQPRVPQRLGGALQLHARQGRGQRRLRRRRRRSVRGAGRSRGRNRAHRCHHREPRGPQPVGPRAALQPGRPQALGARQARRRRRRLLLLPRRRALGPAPEHDGPRTRCRVRSSTPRPTREPRDANQLEDTFNVNLTADWSFPIHGSVRAKIGGEVSNLTDEQEVVDINIATGDPTPGIIAYQVPREFRLRAGISF